MSYPQKTINMTQQIRFLFLSAAMLLLPPMAVAQQRSHSDVRAMAHQQWERLAPLKSAYTTHCSYLQLDSLCCFVAYRTRNSLQDTLPGFILISADKHSPTVLAYSDNAFFPSSSQPEHVRAWLSQYAQLNSTDEESEEAVNAWLKASQTDYDDVLPLLGEMEWGQDNPYNLLCPTIEEKHCPSGCVATALSQIMCYHRWPETGTGVINYTTSTHNIDVSYDFGNTHIEWEKMKNVYSPVEYSSIENDQVLTDSKYFLQSIGVDKNSTPQSKCYVNIGGLTAMGVSSFCGETMLMLTDEDKNVVARASSSFNIESRQSGKISNIKSFLLYVSSGLPIGTYRIYNVVREEDDLKWSFSNTSESQFDYLTLIKEKTDSFLVEGITYPCSLSTEDVYPVATLLSAVGAAVKMDYALGGSGSNDLNTQEGLVKYLGYDQDLYFAQPADYSDNGWHEMLQHELIEGRPVYYTGRGMESGHAFVIDGFKKDDEGTAYYHVNWGWDGLCNGYYLLNMLRPSSAGTGGSSGSNYSNSPSMLIGMKPEDGVSHIKMSCSGIDLLAEEYTAGGFLPLRIRSLTMNTSNSIDGKLQIIIQDEDGYQSPTTVYEEDLNITSKRGLKNYQISAQVPTSLTTGSYTLKLVCIAENGEEIDLLYNEWPKIRIKGTDEWTGGSLTQLLQKLSVGGSVSVQAQGGNGELTLKIDSLVNPMPLYTNGQIALAVCNEEGRMLSIPSVVVSVGVYGYNVRRNVGISTPISRYMPDGKYELRIVYLPQGESLWTFCDRIFCKDNIWWASFSPWYVPMTISGGNVAIQDIVEFEGADIPWTSNIISTSYSATTGMSLTDLLGRKINSPRKGVYIQTTSKGRNKIIK